MNFEQVGLMGIGGYFSEDTSFSQFRPRKIIPDRKSIKLMTRSVQLGVAAAAVTLAQTEAWKKVPPHRRGVFVSASPAINGQEDLRAAIMASVENGAFSFSIFGEKGRSLIHPLWLVRGLSNNILGFVSSIWDFQGENMNYCQGPKGGFHALQQACFAIQEGRLDVALVGAADSVLNAEGIIDKPCAEGGVFLVISRAESQLSINESQIEALYQQLPYVGAASWLIAFWKSIS